jgi:hypothetical protein
MSIDPLPFSRRRGSYVNKNRHVLIGRGHEAEAFGRAERHSREIMPQPALAALLDRVKPSRLL